MKRDNDLIREILLIAGSADEMLLAIELSELIDKFPDITRYILDSHLQFLSEKGLVELHRDRSGIYIERITWDGYDFLAAARNATVWNKVKAVAATSSWDILNYALKEISLKYAANWFYNFLAQIMQQASCRKASNICILLS
ncbi:hypothetical protein FACS189454_10260 [Planctomycetales bacterium]|nr:hypothetical protein FACS189454_10260 [Planctomycetales bacterium]